MQVLQLVNFVSVLSALALMCACAAPPSPPPAASTRIQHGASPRSLSQVSAGRVEIRGVLLSESGEPLPNQLVGLVHCRPEADCRRGMFLLEMKTVSRTERQLIVPFVTTSSDGRFHLQASIRELRELSSNVDSPDQLFSFAHYSGGSSGVLGLLRKNGAGFYFGPDAFDERGVLDLGATSLPARR